MIAQNPNFKWSELLTSVSFAGQIAQNAADYAKLFRAM
jgi:hypothetical protein